MKLQPECIRDVLLFVENAENYTSTDDEIEAEPVWFADICAGLPQYKAEELYYTLTILEEAGFLHVGEYWEQGGYGFMLCLSPDVRRA